MGDACRVFGFCHGPRGCFRPGVLFPWKFQNLIRRQSFFGVWLQHKRSQHACAFPCLVSFLGIGFEGLAELFGRKHSPIGKAQPQASQGYAFESFDRDRYPFFGVFFFGSSGAAAAL